MNRIYKHFKLIFFLTTSVLFLACETELDKNLIDDSNNLIKFSVSIDNNRLNKPITRNEDDELKLVDLNYEANKQDEINELSTIILFFDETGKCIHIVNKGVQYRESGFLYKSKTLEFSIPIEKYTLLQEAGNVKMTVVANTNYYLSVPNITSYEDLEKEIIFTEFNKGTNTRFLLMDGSIDIDFSKLEFSDKRVNLTGKVKLTRAASKIRVLINYQDLYVTGTNGHTFKYSIGDIDVKFVNFTKSTPLISSGLKPVINLLHSTDYIEADHIVSKFDNYDAYDEDVEDLYFTPQYPFYSYETSWLTKSKAPYILIRLEAKESHKEKMSHYLYKAPINLKSNELKRNTYYLIQVNISELGALDPNSPEKPEEPETPEEPEKPEEPVIPVDPVVVLPKITIIKDWEEDIVINTPTIDKPEFLELPEREINLHNQLNYDIPYKSSSPIVAEVERIEYNHYDLQTGMKKVTLTSPTEIKKMNVHAFVVSPTNISFTTTNTIDFYTPVTYYLKVSHKGNKENLLTERAKITFYPSHTLRSKISKGFWVNDRDDFRFHDALGTYSESNKIRNNKSLTRITTYSHVDDTFESIGDPTDSKGYTREDYFSNTIISPDFIIASDRGETIPLKQFESTSKSGWQRILKGNSSKIFAPNYGPVNAYQTTTGAYYRGDYYSDGGKTYQTNQSWYSYTGSAKDRCYNYFEDDYGPDITIEENYINRDGNNSPYKKNIDIRPKYKGRWRLPTEAEMKLIAKYFNAKGSLLEDFMKEEFYWTAFPKKTYNIQSYLQGVRSPETAYVRCVFDVWKVKNHEN